VLSLSRFVPRDSLPYLGYPAFQTDPSPYWLAPNPPRLGDAPKADLTVLPGENKLV